MSGTASSELRCIAKAGNRNLLSPWVVLGRRVHRAAMGSRPGQETIPYHLGYAGLALAFGLDAWSHRDAA